MKVYETAELRVALDVPHKQFTNFFSTCVLYRVRTRVTARLRLRRYWQEDRMYYMITWFGKRATQYTGAWSLNEKNGENAMSYLVQTLRAGWYKGQLEKGHATGRLHMQVMIETNYTMEDCLSIAKDRGWDWHVEPIEDMEEGSLYVGKADTRVAGPWEALERELMDFEEYYEKRSWEEKIEKWLAPGKVLLIVDPVGGMGKTTRSKILEMREETVYIPALGYKDITRYAYNWASKHYIINVERMANIDRQDLWAGIELVSDGISYDDRYESKKAIREKPIVEVHSNRLPKRRMMSDYKYREVVFKGGDTFVDGRDQRLFDEVRKRTQERN